MNAIAGEVADLLLSTSDAPAIRSRLEEIGARHAGLRLHLLAHREPYDGSVSYDVLIRGGGPTVSVGVAGSPTLPWPLRGVVRVDDQTVVRVNGQTVSMAEAAVILEDAWDDPLVLRRLVHAALVEQALADDPVQLDDEALQAASHAFRRARGLYTAERTRAWMAERGISEQRFTGLVTRSAKLAALRRRVTAGRIEEHFEQHRHGYAVLTVAWAVPGDPQSLAADPLGTIAAADDGGVTRWRAAEAPPPLLHADVSTVDVKGRQATAVVLDRREPVLDPATAALVARDVFTAWLEQRRAAADVEWFWGSADRTGDV